LAENAPRIGKKIAQSGRESHADSLPQQTASLLPAGAAEIGPGRRFQLRNALGRGRPALQALF